MIQPPLPDGPPPSSAADPWADYQATTQRLDAVRRAASNVVAGEAQAVQAAQQELQGVRARLAPQRARLVGDLGVPEAELTPQPADRAAAAQAVTGGPVGVLAALHQARATADAADVSMLGAGGPDRPWTPWLRNLMVYGPYAIAVLLVQLALFAVVDTGSRYTWAVGWGLLMPVVAFGLGWLTIGFVFGGEQGRATERTPLLGAVVCAAPVVVTCMGVGLFSIFN
jgi:hypothetical protein